MTGGTWIVGAEAAIDLPNASHLTANNATIDLDGPSSNFARISTPPAGQPVDNAILQS